MHGVIPIDSSEFLAAGQSHALAGFTQVAQAPQTSASQNKAINLPKRLILFGLSILALFGIISHEKLGYMIFGLYGLVLLAVMASILLPIRHAPRAQQKRRMKIFSATIIIAPIIAGVAFDEIGYAFALYNAVFAAIAYGVAGLYDDSSQANHSHDKMFDDNHRGFNDHDQSGIKNDYDLSHELLFSPIYASLESNIHHRP